MSTLGVVALVLAALVVAAVVILYRVVRRSPGVAPGSPRTVADLVRMRAEQAAEAPPALVEPVETGPVAAEPVVAEPVAAEAVAPKPGDPKPGDPEPADTAEGEAAVTSPAVPVAEPPSEPAADPEPGRVGTPAVAQLAASDTPWSRAVRMTEGDGAVWATGEGDHDWSEWADWADVDETASGVPERSAPQLRPVVLPAVSPELFGPRPVPAPAGPVPAVAEVRPAAAVPARPVLALVVDEPAGTEPIDPVVAAATHESDTASEPDATPEELAVRRRTAAETAAEQAAADLALLRTFGCTPASSDLDDEDDAPMSPAVAPAAPAPSTGAAQTVAFRVVGRDGDGIDGAGVTLLDDRGRETTAAVAAAKGRGEVRAPHPGGYVLVSAASGHQPGAVAVTVAAEPVEAEVLLARSASVAGAVFGEDGPIVGARLTLVQEGEIVDTTGTGPDGEYWLSDLAAGDYGLSISAHDCEPVALLLTVPDETDLRHDVELLPVGLPPATATDADDDVMIGQL